MQLKMRENSLFAILLRSSWWYGVVIAAGVVVIAQVVLGGKYALFGVFLAIPFVVIAAISGFRQLQSPGARQLEQTEQWVRRAPARELTAALSAAYQEEGYKVAPFKGRAAELQLEKDGRMRLVSCKRVKAASSGAEPLRALATAGDQREAAGLIFITLGDLSADAREVAAEERIDVLGLEELAALLGERVRDKGRR